MSSGFVSGGTIDKPNERDDEWRAAQAELEAKRLEQQDRDKQHDGKSLYEVLQANKAAKQEAFEEAARLKNQYRGLDDDEADFLDSVLEATRKKEAEVRKDTLEQLDAFRRRQDEAERRLLEEGAPEAIREEEAHWVSQGRKRKKGLELLKGVKLRKASSTVDDATRAQKGAVTETTKHSTLPGSTLPGVSAPAPAPAPKPTLTISTSASPPAEPSALNSLGLGYASSDDDA